MRKVFILFALSGVLITNVFGQENWKIYNTVNTGNNELLGGYVYCFYSDNKDTFWIGSSDGVNTIEGSEWNAISQKVYTI